MDINATAALAAKIANRIDALTAEGYKASAAFQVVVTEITANMVAQGFPNTADTRSRVEEFVTIAVIASIADETL